MRQLIAKDLSEPYSIYVYRYFLYQWGHLCFLAMDDQQLDGEQLVGVVVSKLEPHGCESTLRGYIAMLAVKEEYRGAGIATRLVSMAIDAMKERGAAEVRVSPFSTLVFFITSCVCSPQIALETEITNIPATKLYERLGFLRSKRLYRYYLNGNSAFRLVLYLKEGIRSMKSDDAYSMPVPVPPSLDPPPDDRSEMG